MTGAQRVLVLWADDASPNLGVRALARGTAALVHGVWPEAEVTFQNYGSRIHQLPIGSLRALVRERVFGRRGMQDWFRTFDLIVDTRSGDSFADLYGLHRLAVMTLVAAYASQAGVPVVLGPQTIGPFASRRARLLATLSLKSSVLVFARDSASRAVAESLVTRSIEPATDVVFALPTPATVRSRDVVLNVSGLLWNANPHVDHLAYRRTVVELHERLVRADRRVTVLAHVVESATADSDSRIAREFAASVDAAEVVVPRDLDEVREVVASAELVIGSRMHACLNALSTGTPAIPLAYSDKFTPLLADLDWRHSVDLRTSDDPVGEVLAHAATVTRAEVGELRALAERTLGEAELAFAKVMR